MGNILMARALRLVNSLYSDVLSWEVSLLLLIPFPRSPIPKT